MLSDHQSIRLRLKSWGIGFIVALGLLVGCALFEAPPALAVGIVVTDPITNEVGVDPDADIVATYTAAISPTTVTTRTFVAQGMMSGRRDGTFSFSGGDTVVTLDPDDDYFAGEVIRVSATGRISDTAASPVTPYQWQFTAGPVISRCLAGFSEIGTGLPGLENGSAAWGDYDGDNDLDLVLTGDTGGGFSAGVYRNDGGSFSLAAGLVGVIGGSAVWGDYDNDGDLDIALTGSVQFTGDTAHIYRNDGGSFSDVGAAGLAVTSYGSLAWGDYDNDGDLDMLLTGSTLGGRIARVYRNNGGSFSDIGAGLPGVMGSSAEWGDYDNDGDLDILLVGLDNSDTAIAKVYRNDNNGASFADTGAALAEVSGGSAAWGDYDNDHDLDILLTGEDEGYNRFTRLYRNEGGTFTEVGTAGLAQASGGSATWGDYDNDGDLDILLIGSTSGWPIAAVYRNNGDETFTDIGAGWTGVGGSSVAWGDYDNDGDLDILIIGFDSNGYTSRLYRNNDCADLSISKQVAPTTGVEYHSTVTYTVVLSCTDESNAADVLLTDTLPAEVNFVGWVGDAHGATVTSDEIRWNGTVPAGQALTWSWTAAHAGGYDEVVTNTAQYAFIYGSGSATATFQVNPAPVLGVHVIATDPGTNEVGVDLDANIVATYSDAISPTTVTTQTFVAQGMMSGHRDGAFSFGGGDTVVTLDPDEDYFAGEVVRVSATGGISDALGSPVTPYQWQFTAGPLLDQCAVSFSNQTLAGPSGVTDSSAAWGDYDKDGDLDFLLTGWAPGRPVSELWRNDGNGVFSDQTPAGLPAVSAGSVAWGDYDNDGNLDFLLTGADSGNTATSQLWHNEGDGTFSNQTSSAFPGGLPAVSASSVAWGDYDNDGNLDFLLTGYTGSNVISQLWHNEGDGTFSNQTSSAFPTGLTGVLYSSVAWGDYDNDGNLDFLLAGDTGSNAISQLWQNNGNGTFTNQTSGAFPAGLPGAYWGSAAWGDYDNDSNLDFLLTGYTSSFGSISQLWRNNGNGTFSNQTPAGLPGVYRSLGAWGDYDNDGDLDFLLAGEHNYGRISQLRRNDGNGVFSDQTPAGLPGVLHGWAAWGDYDNDGRLDFLWTGGSYSDNVTQLWHNKCHMVYLPLISKQSAN